MLAFAIALLFTSAGLLAVFAIADSAVKARHAYLQLLREAALMQAGFMLQIEPQELRLRRAAVRITPLRRAQALRMQALRVSASA